MSKIININRLDAHDRLKHLTDTQYPDISETVEKIRKEKPFGDYLFYLIVHARTADDGVTKRLIWQPRLTKPKAQTNSMLFKLDPKSDIVRIVWIIPPREQWYMFEKGMLTESEIVKTSVHNFMYNRKELEAKEPDDLPDEKIDEIYREISQQALRSRANA